MYLIPLIYSYSLVGILGQVKKFLSVASNYGEILFVNDYMVDDLYIYPRRKNRNVNRFGEISSLTRNTHYYFGNNTNIMHASETLMLVNCVCMCVCVCAPVCV